VEINFYFSNEARKRLTWDDLDTIEMMQEGQVSTRRIRALAARFMTNEGNEYLPFEQAYKSLGKLTEEEITDVLKKFTEAMKGAAVPNPNGGSSKPPSEVAQPSESLPGSES
jgi:hypothetical protein